MPRENYRRIVKGYEPREPAAFFEKVFYIFWSFMSACNIILMLVKPKATKGR